MTDTQSPESGAGLPFVEPAAGNASPAFPGRPTLRESEARYESVVRKMSHGVVIHDASGAIVFANAAAERILGLTAERIVGRTCDVPDWQAVHEDGSDFPGAEHPAQVARQTGREVRNVVMGLPDPGSGERRWLTIDAVPSTPPGASPPFEVMAIFEDITERKRTDAQRVEQEEFLRQILRTSADGFWILDAEGKVREINDAFCRMLGYSREVLMGMSIREINAIEPLVETKARMHRIIERGSELFETCHRRKDGSVYDVEVSTTYMNRDGGRFVCFGRDITERKRVEAALRESEQRFKNVFDASPDATLLIDGETFVDCNAAAARMLGYARREDLLMKHPSELSPPLQSDGRPSLEKADEMIAVVHARGTHSFEWEHLKAGGGIVPVEVSAMFVLMHGRNLLHVVWRDITERRQAEEERSRLAARYQLLFDRANDGILVLSTDGTLLSVNESFARMHGYDPQELRGLNLRDLDTPETSRLVPARMRRLLAGEALTFEVEHFHRDGHVIPLEVSASLASADGSAVIQAFNRDITERRRAEAERSRLEAQLQQSQKLESVGRLAGGVAHDFNNMLGVILGHAEMGMELVDSSHALHANLDEIHKAARRSADLTRQLLAFARRQIVAPRVLDLNQAVSGLLSMLQRLIGEDIRLQWQPEEPLWPVKVDPSQVDQILVNLCVNARDAIADVGRITLETGNVTLDEDYCAHHPGFVPGEYVMLAVDDDGCGMDQQTQAHVFEPFFTTKGMGKGTGLGLATVYGAVKQNEGFIHFSSEPGRGTTFKIYLPRHRGGTGPDAAREAAEPLPRGNEAILLVEDEPAVLNLSTRLLETQGYTVLAAGSPGEAIRLAREHAGEIQLLLTDVVMPEMNGRDLAQHLLALHPHLRVLYTSGHTASAIAQHGVLDEGVHFLQKPFSIRELSIRVREALRG